MGTLFIVAVIAGIIILTVRAFINKNPKSTPPSWNNGSQGGGSTTPEDTNI